LEPTDAFEPIAQPEASDWLAQHHESGQTYEQFVKSRPNIPDRRHGKFYLQPLGEFASDLEPSLDTLKQFAEAFFMLEVRVLPAVDVRTSDITTRTNPYTGKKQLLTKDLLKLLSGRLPDDAYMIIGITMEDLYPDPEWNFVFGQASLRERVGVYSFARYDPRFYGQEYTEQGKRLVLQRSCKVLAHESSHMFGIRHCIYFECLMNGSNHLDESDSRPMFLCPVCLRKLHHSVRFDVLQRYLRLQDFYRDEGFDEQAQWLNRRFEHLAFETDDR
jgi:archaemetzincin